MVGIQDIKGCDGMMRTWRTLVSIVPEYGSQVYWKFFVQLCDHWINRSYNTWLFLMMGQANSRGFDQN